MKNLFLLLLQRLLAGLKSGKDEYVRAISEEDPRLTLHIWGWFKNIAAGLWNGVKGVGKSFFGGGGEVVIRGKEETPGAPVLRVEDPPPSRDRDEDGKPNILLYVGIGVAVIVFVIVLAMVLRARK